MSRNVGVASVIWAVGILLSRLVGLVREAVIGRTLGTGPDADLYFAAFILPDFLNYLLAGGVLSIVFIPLFQAHLVRDDEAGAWRAFSLVGTFAGALLLVATAALWFAAPALVEPMVAPGLTAAQHARLVDLIRIILPAQVFHVLGGLLSAALQARDRHGLAAAAPVVYAASIVVGGLVTGTAEGFCWGVLVGSALGPFGLTLYGNLTAPEGQRLRYRPGVELGDADFRAWLWRSLPVMLGFSVVALDDLVVKRYASLVGSGEIARLTYARVLMKVPMGVFGMAAGLAAFPTLSRLVAEGRRPEAYATLVRALRVMLLLALTAQAALTVAGAEIAEVIWGRARFSAADLEAIGRYTALLCLGLWAWSAQLLVARGFYAEGRTWGPTLVGTVVLLGALPLYGRLAASHGGAGLAVASSVAISLYVLVLAVWLRASLGGPDAPALLLPILRLAACAGLGVGAGWGLDAALPALPALVRGGLTGGLAALATLGVALALRLPEARSVVEKLRRRGPVAH